MFARPVSRRPIAGLILLLPFAACTACGEVASGQLDGVDASTSDATTVHEDAGVVELTLTVERLGEGQGEVRSSSSEIACGDDCTETLAQQTPPARIALIAAPAMGSVFDSWSGACSGSEPTCEVELDGSKNVIAAFAVANVRLDLRIDGPGLGAVQSSDSNLDCGADCSHDYRYGSEVILNAVADSSSAFRRWIGGPCDAETAGTCRLSMVDAKSVAAEFSVIPRVALSEHTCFLSSEGMVRCWGPGMGGRLGQNSSANIGDGLGATIVGAGDIDVGIPVLQISTGGGHTCVRTRDENVRCWGSAIHGRLGYDSTTGVSDGGARTIESQGDVMLGLRVKHVEAGAIHTCALLETGNVRCWGSGSEGRLGYGDTRNVGDGVGRSVAEIGDVPIGDTVLQISAGADHTCAMLANGAVRCWGAGAGGQLGYDSTVNVGDGVGLSIEEAGDVPLGGPAIQIAAGHDHTCALLRSGAVRCWGYGQFGRLGNNSDDSIGDGMGQSIVAAGNISIGAPVLQIRSGGSHTCVLLDGGAARCWGWGLFGQLGYGETTNVASAPELSIVDFGDVAVGSLAKDIATGSYHTCALLTNDAVRCWGSGGDGALGHNNRTNIADGIGPSIIAAGDVPIR